MTEDKDWQQLGEEWRQNVPVLPVAHQEILAQVQRSSKRTRWLAMFSLATALIAMISLIIMALANRGILTYSFAVIGLSAFLPLCSYLVVYRRNIFADTLDSGLNARHAARAATSKERPVGVYEVTFGR